MTRIRKLARDEHGIALLVVILLVVTLGAMSLGASMVSMNTGLIRRYGERNTISGEAAIAGLEEARSRLNGDDTLYPDSGFVTLESNATVRDASGTIIPGFTRTTYAGPSGVTSGQFGVFGSLISVISDNQGIRTIRRMEVNQESFAKYAYFTDFEPSTIAFGGGDQIWGPVHSNDFIKIYSSGARFRDIVRTAQSVTGAQYGTFDKGYQEDVTPIPLPNVTALSKLQSQAAMGSMSFAAFTSGTQGQARTRVEFVAVDLNGDGDTTDEDEGFIRVYQGAAGNEAFVVADRPTTLTTTRNCGDFQGTHGPAFQMVGTHPTSGGHTRQNSIDNNTARCYLGGDNTLTNGFVAANADGQWLPWAGPVDPRLPPLRADAAYLHPITRNLNPNFKGVIYFAGKVAVSGTVRGRATVAASDDIIVVDNVRQATDPSVGTCDDILGFVAGDDIIIADNMLNAPVNTSGSNWKTMRSTGNQDEYLHAVVLALDIFTVENYDTGPQNAEDCGTTNWGRGCLQLTGGIIQRTRGAVGTTAGTGNLKRYSYNACALTDPPPYFPTTGHFARNRFYEVNPAGFNVATWFGLYQN